MKISNSPDFSPELERIIYPKSYLVREIGKYTVVGILTLSQQYSDPNALKSAKIQSNLIWHAINEIYEPAFGKCGQTATQLQGVRRVNDRALHVINCKNGKILLEGTLK